MNFRGEAAFAVNSKDVAVWKLVGLEKDKTLHRARRVERNTNGPESITIPSVCLEALRFKNRRRHRQGTCSVTTNKVTNKNGSLGCQPPQQGSYGTYTEEKSIRHATRPGLPQTQETQKRIRTHGARRTRNGRRSTTSEARGKACVRNNTRLKRDGCVTVCAGSLDTQRVHVPCVLECVV